MDPARHTGKPCEVHGQEGEMKAQKHQPKRNLAKMFGRHAAGKVRQPVISGRQYRKNHSTNQHIVQMRHNEVSIVHLPPMGLVQS